MVFDTDVLVWVLRGNAKAAKAVDEAETRGISVVTYMGLVQGARNKGEVKAIKAFLADLKVRALPLTENVGHRATIYMEEYGLIVALTMAGALIAATAIEFREQLLTGNARHYRPIKELDLRRFRP